LTLENEKIALLLGSLRESLAMLKEYEGISLKNYRSERKIQDIVEREFERGIHACADIGARIISIKGLTPAATYVEIFDILSDQGFIGADLADGMKDLVRFRNILAHEYFRIDHKKVHRLLKRGPKILREFARTIDTLL